MASDTDLKKPSIVLCETHGRLRCGECAYVEQLEEENQRMKLFLQVVQKEGTCTLTQHEADYFCVSCEAKKVLELI